MARWLVFPVVLWLFVGCAGSGGTGDTTAPVAASTPEPASLSGEDGPPQGSLDPNSIARVVRARMRMIKHCYELQLKRDPSLSGKIEVEFTIDTGGRVSESAVVSNSMGSTAVGDCIVGRTKRWRFPRPSGGSVTVSYPFIFTPSS